MILRLKKVKVIFLLIILSFNTAKSNQIFDATKKQKDFVQKGLTSEFDNSEDGEIWNRIFLGRSSKEISEFIQLLPNRNPNPVIQEIIYNILTSKKSFKEGLFSKKNDEKIFELLIKQLFETGRISEIELYYSQSTFLKDNEFILMKMIEGNFLRNRHAEACKILDTKANKAPAIFGKIIIICDILNNKYDQAKLGLLLLKEQSEPGDTFFIDLAYSLMSDDDLSKSQNLKKNLEQIKSLNPIIMSSLQYADISPNYEQVENLNTSGLLFILSNPAVDTDIKIFCAELLVKQGRIGDDFLSEAYLLPRFSDNELENSIKIYKTLSPAKARPLLYQSIISEKNNETKIKKIIALLKVSGIDNLFFSISNLVSNFIDIGDSIKTKEDSILISKMYQTQKDFDKAISVLGFSDNKFDLDLILRELSIEISKLLSGEYIDKIKFQEKVAKLNSVKEIASEKHQKIIMNLILNFNFIHESANIISNLKFLNSEKVSNNSIQNLFLAESFSKNKDSFNSLKVFFETVGNTSFENLSLIESYQSLIILKNLGLEDEFKKISEQIL